MILPLVMTHCVGARREVVSRADAANRLGVSPLPQASLRPSEGLRVSVRQRPSEHHTVSLGAHWAARSKRLGLPSGRTAGTKEKRQRLSRLRWAVVA